MKEISEISSIRKKIDEIDSKINELLDKRSVMAREIGKYKQKYNEPLFVPGREKKIIENIISKSKSTKDGFPLKAKINIFNKIIAASRDLQKKENGDSPLFSQKKWGCPRPRKIIESFSPYVSGRSIEEIKDLYGLKEVVKLASNENLWGASPIAIEEIKKELTKINLYPQTDPVRLKEKIADKFSLSPDEIILGSGTDELIELIARTFLCPNSKVVVSQNSFIRFKMAARLMESEVVEVPQNNFKIDLNRFLNAIDDRTKIIFIDNPCNPTGTFVNEKEIKEFIQAVEKLKSPPLIVFDEAYYEYAECADEYTTALKFSDKNISIIVLRTFSKIYGLAGVRIGYGISSSEIISLINRIRAPFNTNRLAQAAAMGALKEEKFHKDIAQQTEIEKKYLYDEFKKLDIEYIPSVTNFIMTKFGAPNVQPLCEYLLKRGVILRALDGYDLNDYIRITIGKREHNIKLIQGISTFLRN